jgi:RNA polymerase sigma-70 factor, ECF subfamily
LSRSEVNPTLTADRLRSEPSACLAPLDGSGFCEQAAGTRATTVVMSESHTASGRDAAAIAVTAWFEEHVSTIHRYAARRVGEHEAWDVVAETFRVALERFDEFDDRRGHERPWLYGIASNILRRHARTEARQLRARARAATANGVPGDPLIDSESKLDAIGEAERVAAAVEALDPDDRELLVLVAWEHLSSAEVAVAMGIPAGTVRSRLRRIRSQLRVSQGGSR